MKPVNIKKKYDIAYCIFVGVTVFDKGIIINHNKNRANLH